MKTFLVGGAVRDQLLGFPFTERDWVVVGASPEEMLKQGFRPVGKDFPVFLHPQTGEEYALARTERKTAPGYKGFVFHTDNDVSLEEDLERRDLTINAIAQDEHGELIDPYGGQDDIDDKKLRHVSLAFAEDPVRILRVARFSARYHHLGFRIAAETLDLMHAMVERGETRHLVAERVWQECQKALAEASPVQFFSTLKLCGALNDIFPELNSEIYPLCIESLQGVSQNTKPITHRSQYGFAALCYPLTLEQIDSLCQRLGVPNSYRDLTLLCKKHHVTLIQLESLTAQTALDIIQQSDANRKTERFLQLLELSQILAAKNDKDIIGFWQRALHAFQSVDHQALITAGYQKAALGEAINKERLKALTVFLSHNAK